MCTVKYFVACLFIGIIAAQNGLLKDKDAIGFPEQEENQKAQNKEVIFKFILCLQGDTVKYINQLSNQS